MTLRADADADDDLVITEATRRGALKRRRRLGERPPVTLKGKAVEVRLYASRVLDARD